MPQRIDTSSEADSNGRVNTSTDPSSDSDLDIAAPAAVVGLAKGAPVKAAPARAATALPRRPYNAGRARQAKHSVTFLGKRVCFHAARDFVGVGLTRLYRLKDGHIDGRSDSTKRARGPMGLAPQAAKAASVLRFLWAQYHSVGQGMPDKFTFERPDLRCSQGSSTLPFFAQPCYRHQGPS